MKRKQREDSRIVQIVPAQPGWEAVWAWDPPDEGEAEAEKDKYYTEPVVCWALIELGGKQLVTALSRGGEDADLTLVFDAVNFLGYAYPGLPSSDPEWELRADESRSVMAEMFAREDQSKETPDSD